MVFNTIRYGKQIDYASYLGAIQFLLHLNNLVITRSIVYLSCDFSGVLGRVFGSSEVGELCLFGLFNFLIVVRLVRVLIEVLEILITGQLGDPWRLNALLFDYVPVDALEPCICLDIFSSAA